MKKKYDYTETLPRLINKGRGGGKSLIISSLLLFMFTALQAQEIVKGVVRDDTGEPLPGVYIESESGQSTETDADGKYTITAKRGEKLTFSLIGKEDSIKKVSGAELNVVLRNSSATQIGKVVVTALGIKREKKSLGYSSQKLSAEQVNSSPSSNFLNNLSGKVSGLSVRNNQNFGGSTNIVLRGHSSITGNNQALIVIDGVPISNSNLNSTTGPEIGFDFGNSASDIDPNNVASVNILKGAAATVLYGSAAANGAIIITTKKGQQNNKLGITLNSTVSVGSIDKSTFAKYQKQYGAGYDGVDSFSKQDIDGDGNEDLLAPTGDDASYGVAFNPNLSVYQWDSFVEGNPNFGKPTPWVAAKNDPSTFFKHSLSFINSINLNGGDDKNTYNFTYTNHNEEGILPNSRLNKNTISGNFSRDFTDKLTASTFLTFVDQSTVGRNVNGYNDNILTGFRQWWPINVDIQEQKREYFRTRRNITWNQSDPAGGNLNPAYWDNPYWDRYENYESDEHSRLLLGTRLNYKITPDFSILGRITLDKTTDKQELRKAVGSHSENFGLSGVRIQGDGVIRPSINAETSGYQIYTRDFLKQMYDLIAAYDWKINESINAKLLGGGTFEKSNASSVAASTTGGLIQPGIYSLTNSQIYTAPLQSEVNYEKSGIYGQASLDYQKFIYLEGSIRRDQSTALPKEHNAYAYYAVSSSFILSEFIKAQWLDYLKLRGGYAQVGNDPAPGRLGVKSLVGNFDGNPLYQNNPVFVDFEKLKPEKQKSWEAGIEARFLKNRILTEVSLYKNNTTDLIFSVPVSPAGGYSYQLINAGETENKGIEAVLGLMPIKTRVFQWNMDLNWAKNKNKVVELSNGRHNLQLQGFNLSVTLNATEGQPYGTFRGTGYVYDKNGNKVVDEDGHYKTKQDQVIGNVQPDWTGGIYNTFTYKNFSLGFLIDIQQGGDIFCLDQAYGQGSGLYPSTAGLNERGQPVRSPVAQGGGVILPGVYENGTPNITRLDASKGSAFGYIRYPAEQFIYDASYIKLREAKISYTLPQKFLRNHFIKGATFSILGNNLWIIHKNVPYADPESTTSSGNTQGYQSGVMPSTRVFSFNIQLTF